MHTHIVINKMGENVGTYFDDNICDALHWNSISQAYTRVLHAQDFPKRMAMDVYCNVH